MYTLKTLLSKHNSQNTTLSLKICAMHSVFHSKPFAPHLSTNLLQHSQHHNAAKPQRHSASIFSMISFTHEPKTHIVEARIPTSLKARGPTMQMHPQRHSSEACISHPLPTIHEQLMKTPRCATHRRTANSSKAIRRKCNLTSCSASLSRLNLATAIIASPRLLLAIRRTVAVPRVLQCLLL